MLFGSKEVHLIKFLFIYFFTESHVAIHVTNTLNITGGKGWAEAEPEGLSPGSQGDLLMASTVLM